MIAYTLASFLAQANQRIDGDYVAAVFAARDSLLPIEIRFNDLLDFLCRYEGIRESNGIHLAVTRKRLADAMGCRLETISREITKGLRSGRILSAGRNTMVLP